MDIHQQSTAALSIATGPRNDSLCAAARAIGRCASARPDWGLVNEVVPAAGLRERTREVALKIAEASPLTLAIGKQAYYTQVDLDQPKAYAYAKEVMSMNAMTGDAQEGMAAFLGKRAACWAGK